MRKTIVLLALTLICLNAFAVAPCANDNGMTESPQGKFIYWIGIGTGTTLTRYQSIGTDNFLLDISIRPNAESAPPLLPDPFQSEFFFKCQCGYCMLTGQNDVIISKLFAEPNYVVVNNATTINAEITNNNPDTCTVQGLDPTIGIAHEAGAAVDCSPTLPAQIPGNSSAMLQCTTQPLTLEGRYDVSAKISNVSFEGTNPACIDTPLGNSESTYFTVARRPPGVSFPVPETSEIAVVIVAFAAVVLIRRRK